MKEELRNLLERYILDQDPPGPQEPVSDQDIEANFREGLEVYETEEKLLESLRTHFRIK